ncbi:MAG TPA: UDP-N-acetylglucosamine 2-epimerase (non-hydrolyzing) [Xanthobacteraceae bacterium]|nr:UDP-N-acetylglucosamine 2-epimerase (non-hydrolyzing) [Xanthobacteraceae bacterium]
MSADKTRGVRCACVVGTRPEVIKMAPVIRRLQESDWAVPVVIATGQHDELLDMALADFAIRPDHVIPHDMNFGAIVNLLGAVAAELDGLLEKINPRCVIAQGDTTTVFAASLAAFYRRIPFVHVEAGLRTGDLSAPFPEEFHRRVVSVATALHCAPTSTAAAQLRRESIPDRSIVISGNTVIDALLETAAEKPEPPKGFPKVRRPVLMTAHRRENFGGRFREAFSAVRAFIDESPETALFFPVHPNPAAHAAAHEVLSGHPRIVLTEPLPYREMVGALQNSWIVVTDSGGLQEEAPALGKPVLVLRDVTERSEVVEAGAVRLVGTERERIVRALTELRDNAQAYERMARPVFPYGDGHAAKRIISSISQLLSEGG